MAGRRRHAIVGAAVIAVLAGCSSSPGPAAQAQAQRSAVLPVAKLLYGQLYRAGIGWAALILGSYEDCGAHDPLAVGTGASKLQYITQQLIGPFSHAVSYPAFSQQVVQAVDASGWQLRKSIGPSSQDSYYAGARGGFDLLLVELNGNPGGGPMAYIYISSGNCFDAGSSANSLLEQGTVDSVSEPRPTSTPTPTHT